MAWFTLITLALAGFMAPETMAGVTEREYRYIITETAGPNSFDPLDGDNTINLPVIRMIYATPLETGNNNQLSSRILESFKYESSKREIEWKVKSGVKYEDGTSIDAEDVAFAVARMAYTRPKFPILESIKGLNEWLQTNSPLKTLPKGITVSGSVVKIQFATEVDHPLFRFCLELFSVIPRKCVDTATNKITCKNIPESGPYRITKQDQLKISFQRRDSSDSSLPKQIQFEYRTPEELEKDLQTIDAQTVVAGNESFYSAGSMHNLEKTLSVKYTPAARFAVLLINPDIGPFRDVKCRQYFSRMFRKAYGELAKESPVEGSIFTKILPGYLPIGDLESKVEISQSTEKACREKLAKEPIAWGFSEPEKDAIFFQTLRRTFDLIGIKSSSGIAFKTKKEYGDAFSDGKIAFFNGGSGFWALDPAGDIKMLFTPNLHKPLKKVAEDPRLQKLLSKIGMDTAIYKDVNRHIFEEARLNVYTHHRRFFASKQADLIGDVPFAITSPAPWQVFQRRSEKQ